jgi:MFS family permease
MVSASRLAFLWVDHYQQFALYFFSDVIGVEDPLPLTTRFLAIAIVFMLLAVLPAGYFSDRIGRKRICICSACWCLWHAGYSFKSLCYSFDGRACLLGLALGAFNSSNWALATDSFPKERKPSTWALPTWLPPEAVRWPGLSAR